jgi:hypothetical protein
MGIDAAVFHFGQLSLNAAPLQASYNYESQCEESNIESKSCNRLSLPEPIPRLARALLFSAFALGLSGLVFFAWGLWHSKIALQNLGFSFCVAAVVLGLGTAFITTLLV